MGREPRHRDGSDVLISSEGGGCQGVFAAWVGGAIFVTLAIAAVMTGELAALALVLPMLGVGAFIFRISMLRIEARADELKVRNPFRTYRIRRSEIASIELRRLQRWRFGKRESPVVETRSGTCVVLQAAMERVGGPELSHRAAEDAIRRLELCWQRDAAAP